MNIKNILFPNIAVLIVLGMVSGLAVAAIAIANASVNVKDVYNGACKAELLANYNVRISCADAITQTFRKHEYDRTVMVSVITGIDPTCKVIEYSNGDRTIMSCEIK